MLVQLSYRASNTFAVRASVGSGAAATGFFLAHVLVTPMADDSIVQKEGGRIQPTMYGGSATKQPTVYHVDPGWTFQAPWDCQIGIVSGGVSDSSVMIDVIVKLGVTPEVLVDGPHFAESMMEGAHIAYDVRSQRVYAPPVVGHPELVPATYVNDSGSNALGGRANPITTGATATIPFPDGASQMQVTDSVAITPAPTSMLFSSMGNLWTMGLKPGGIESLGGIAQGGGSRDSAPAMWGPNTGTTIYKAVIWSKLGC